MNQTEIYQSNDPQSELNQESQLQNDLQDYNLTVPTENRFQWVVPLIEGIPPSPRGGHTATKVGRFLILFGVFLKGPFLQRKRRRFHLFK